MCFNKQQIVGLNGFSFFSYLLFVYTKCVSEKNYGESCVAGECAGDLECSYYDAVCVCPSTQHHIGENVCVDGEFIQNIFNVECM